MVQPIVEPNKRNLMNRNLLSSLHVKLLVFQNKNLIQTFNTLIVLKCYNLGNLGKIIFAILLF